VATPLIHPYVVPIAVVILIGIFAIQQHGTDRVGRLFGPVMVLWFVTIAVLGVRWIVHAPVVLGALDPRHAVAFFDTHGVHGSRCSAPCSSP
jgi:KUP system potassium uptake protein